MSIKFQRIVPDDRDREAWINLLLSVEVIESRDISDGDLGKLGKEILECCEIVGDYDGITGVMITWLTKEVL